MAKRMLIDASHPEETRVAVVSGHRLEELDFETSGKNQLKGNIYLAKVTRVEPSLQAAFVDYGGNRHGFLAFNEIHPDYYRLPIADREALLAEEEAFQKGERPDEEVEAAAATVADDSNGAEKDDAAGGDKTVEIVGGEEIEEVEGRRRRRIDRYKIQEVIKRRQIMLVQVVKEERGNKGAALTTYISLAGRYCVLMPNTARGGGVSRKITSATDRRRLKKFVEDLDIPDGMAVIVRTAGAERSKAEIRRDYEYLARTWEEIRETTLKSTAPALIYEEANLIKRSIRDVYSRDIDEILVEGQEGYRTAKEFMRRLTPSHAKRVKLYKDETIPLFFRYQVEGQIDSIHSPQIQLKSGGYIVINPTEALVAIDVNSGKATKERHIEETAYKTNLEAAEEIARQLRLRDLAGLVVIDFIDMEESRNQAAVERRLKDALRVDRARIQVGRISPFGLLEMSRQRLRPSLIETSMVPCENCHAIGYIRSTESMSLHVLRAIEEEGIRQRSSEIDVVVPTEVALYVLNQKRRALADIEQRYNFSVAILADPELVPPEMRIERVRAAETERKEIEVQPMREAVAEETEAEQDRKEGRRRRSRRRRRDRDGEEPAASKSTGDEIREEDEIDTSVHAEPDKGEEGLSESGRKRRRRGRRGGRRRSRRSGEGRIESSEGADVTAVVSGADDEPEANGAPSESADRNANDVETSDGNGRESGSDKISADRPAKSRPRRRAPRKTKSDKADAEAPSEIAEPAVPAAEPAPPEAKAEIAAAVDSGVADSNEAEEGREAGSDKSRSQRRGWWRRAETA